MDLKNFIPTYTKQPHCSFKYRFTVFTPFYNSADTIHRVFKSLNAQTFKDFELVLINDGSTDNSDDVVRSLMKSANFEINYIINTKNKHKMACFMEAATVAKGEFLLSYDADDECLPESLEVFNMEYNNIPDHLKEKICAITVNCIDQYGNSIGSKFPESPYYSDTFKSYYIDGVKGEKWGFTKTNVLRGIQFNDDFVTNGFMAVSIIWNLLAKEGYVTKYLNRELRVYYLSVENSISASAPEKTALGKAIKHIANLNWFYNKYRFKTPVFFLKNIYFLLKHSNYLDYKFNDYYRALDQGIIKLFFTLSWPFRRLFK